MPALRLLVPNILTAVRLAAGPVFLVAGEIPASPAQIALLTGAALTDAVDGRIAKAIGATSRVGAVLDTTSDKVFVLSLALKLASSGVLPMWLFWTFTAQYVILAIEGTAFVKRFGAVPTPDTAARVSAVLAAVCVLVGLLPSGHVVFRSLALVTAAANLGHLVTALRRVLAASSS